jgi:thioredoxin-like negative regulator of GroEL
MTLLFFKADWCTTCGPVLDRVRGIAEGSGHELQILNVAEQPGLREASRLHVRSLPTLIVTENQIPMITMTGTAIPERLANFLNGGLRV